MTVRHASSRTWRGSGDCPENPRGSRDSRERLEASLQQGNPLARNRRPRATRSRRVVLVAFDLLAFGYDLLRVGSYRFAPAGRRGVQTRDNALTERRVCPSDLRVLSGRPDPIG